MFKLVRTAWFVLTVTLFCSAAMAVAAEPLFRTDGGDPKLPWFQLKPGEFPPEGSAHAVSGELIGLDHVNRSGLLRPDRDDTQRRGEWDIPRPFTLLPYGSLRFHGAPAELKDIPLGTHLHGEFYADPVIPKGGSATFTRVVLLEDDFSHFIRKKRSWRVDSVQPELGTLTVTGLDAESKPDPKPTTFQINAATRVWKGRSLGTLSDLAPGQSVLINLTVCTLKGPGRCREIWLDPESRDVATAQQMEVHRQHQREHGLAGWVDDVDNKQGTMAVTLFAGFDPQLMKDFAPNDTITACVAEDSLRTWDQINDRKSGPLLAVESKPASLGNSGYRVRLKPSLLLEGFRPRRIVRIFPSAWKVDDLPREERLYP